MQAQRSLQDDLKSSLCTFEHSLFFAVKPGSNIARNELSGLITSKIQIFQKIL
jgi:hypothetical protein